MASHEGVSCTLFCEVLYWFDSGHTEGSLSLPGAGCQYAESKDTCGL